MPSRLPAQDPLRSGKASTRALWVSDALWKKLAAQASELGYRSTNAYVIDLLIAGVREQESSEEK